MSLSVENMNSYGALKTAHVFMSTPAAGFASWSLALLQFRNSNCFSEMNSAAMKCSYLTIFI